MMTYLHLHVIATKFLAKNQGIDVVLERAIEHSKCFALEWLPYLGINNKQYLVEFEVDTVSRAIVCTK